MSTVPCDAGADAVGAAGVAGCSAGFGASSLHAASNAVADTAPSERRTSLRRIEKLM
jgi:hypothetical protein